MILNYAAWKGNICHILQAILAWTIIDGTEGIHPLTGPRATPAESYSRTQMNKLYPTP
jgi:hypothetical protein